MRVLLIQPSARDCVKTLFSIYNAEGGIGFKPPIGLLYIATTVRERTGCDVTVLDCQLDDIHQGNILELVREPYDVIGISAWTDFWYQASGIAKTLKSRYPNSHIVMGGPHVNIYPEEVLGFDYVDSIVMGDGEIPMSMLVDRLAKGGASDEIPGVYFRGRTYKEYLPYICEDLDSLPIPDRTLLPIKRYYSVLSPSEFVTSMITSRGCPYRCVYCKLKFQRPVARSAESVIKEFETIHVLGIKEVEIYDDTFNWNHDRTEEVCRGLIAKRLGVTWAIRDRVDRVKESLLVELKRAGCNRIHLGVESGSNAILKAIKKGITTDVAREAVRLAKKHGFMVLAYFMYGLPTETLDDARQTLDFALRLDSDYAEFSIMIPYPGTEVYENALKDGTIPVDYWRDFTRRPIASFEIPYVLENLMTKKDLLKLRNLSIRKYYFRLAYMLREFRKLRSWPEFHRKFKMGMGLFNLLGERCAI